MVCGSQASGKTELFKTMVGCANERYGSENVNAMISKENPAGMMQSHMSGQLIQMICVDDATNAFSKKNKDGLRQINTFFKVRHIAQKAGMTRGLIIVFFLTHRFHGIPLEFRTESFYIVFKSLPTNPYDRNVVEKYVGGNGIDDLRGISLRKEVDLSMNRFSICYSYDGGVGLMALELKKADNISYQLEDSEQMLREIYADAGIDIDVLLKDSE